MSIKRTIITTVVALAVVAMVAPAATSADQLSDLTAMIAQLQAQLAALQGSTTTTVGTGACTGVTFTRNLTVGATGSDVKCLQSILNRTATTRVAATGAGAPGFETSYFGPKTLVAVKVYQAAKGFTPANQVGPMTRAALNAELGTTGGTVPPVVVPTGAGLTVQLAFDNPAAGSVLSGTNSGQSQAPLAKLTFVNGDNVAAKVTTLKLRRIGVSGDSDLDAVYLFNGSVRLTDAASISSGVMTFNDSTGLFTVPAMSSTTITVSADINNGLNGGTIGVALSAAADVTSTASAVKGNFPLNGNLMSIVNSGTNLATAYFSVATTAISDASPTGNTSSSGIDPQNDYPVWYTNLNVSINNGVVKMSRLALQEVGSISYSDIQNFRLYVDGVQAGNAVASLDANGYVTFDLASNPVSMSSGSRQVKVLADIIGGSSRYFTFRLKNASDVTLTDSQYNVTITATDNHSNDGVTDDTINSLRSCYISGSYSCYVNAGATTTIKTSDSPTGNVINGATNALLGKWTLKANGEAIKIDSLKAYAAFYNTIDTITGNCSSTSAYCTSPTLRNAALYANGVQVGNTTSLSTNSASLSTFNLGSSLILQPGVPVTLELKADIYDNAGINDFESTDTLRAYLVTQTGNGTGQVSATSVDVPSSTNAANALTITAGSIELVKQGNYANQSTVVPQTAYKLAAWNLTGSNAEAVNVNTIAVNFTVVTDAGGSAFNYADLSNVYVKYGSNVTTTKTSVAATGTSWSVSNFTVPVNGVIPVEVYADIGSSISDAASIKAESTITGLTASSSQSVSTSVMVDGQTIAAAAGTFTGAKDTASTAVAQIVPDNSTVAAAAFKFTALNDSYKIAKLTFTIPATGVTDIANVVLKDGTTELARLPGAATVVFNLPTSGAGSVQVLPGTTNAKTLTVALELGAIGTGAGSTGGDLTVTLDADSEAIAGSTGVQGDITRGTTYAGNALYAFASIPTITNVALPSSALQTGGWNTVAKFTISSGGTGTIAWKKLVLAVTKSDGPTIAADNAIKLYDADSGVEIAIEDTASTTGNLATDSDTAGNIVLITDEEQQISGAKTYLVKANVAGSFTVNTEFVSTSIAAGTTHVVSDDYTAVAGTGATFVWSDVSDASHDATSTSVLDWNNDYLVKNIPTDAQRLTF